MPAGEIFIHASLYDSLESEDELEAIIAHEIAHVERRHALKAYNASIIAAYGTAMMGTIAAGAINETASNDSAAGVIGGFALLGVTAANVYLHGYSKDSEREADFLASVYFDRQLKPKAALELVLRKMSYHQLGLIGNPDAESSTHPQIYERLDRIAHTRYQLFGNSHCLVHKEPKRAPVKMNILYHKTYADESYIELYIDNYSLVRKCMASDGDLKLRIDDNGKTRLFVVDKSRTTQDTWGAYLFFKEAWRKAENPLEKIVSVSLFLIEKGNRPEDDRQEVVVFQEAGKESVE